MKRECRLPRSTLPGRADGKVNQGCDCDDAQRAQHGMSRIAEASQAGVDQSQARCGTRDQEHHQKAERRRGFGQRWSAHRRHLRSLLGIKCARKTSANPRISTPSATSTKLAWDGPAGKSAMAARTMIHPPNINKNPIGFMKNLVYYSSARLFRDWRVR
jgi:hypothetical protein